MLLPHLYKLQIFCGIEYLNSFGVVECLKDCVPAYHFNGQIVDRILKNDKLWIFRVGR